MEVEKSLSPMILKEKDAGFGIVPRLFLGFQDKNGSAEKVEENGKTCFKSIKEY